jgi:hypothetical protein
MLGKAPGVFAPGEICNARWDGIRTDVNSFLKFRADSSAADRTFCYPTSQTQTNLLDDYLSFIRLTHSHRRAVILDVKYSHVHNFNTFWWEPFSRPFLLEYAINRNIKIIHLVREKPYRTIISRMYAEQSGVWRTKNAEDVSSLKITIDRGTLQQMTRRLCDTIALFNSWVKGSQEIRLSYEPLAEDTEEHLMLLQHFLDLPTPIPADSDFIRTTPQYENVIENFSDIADLIDIDLAELNGHHIV